MSAAVELDERRREWIAAVNSRSLDEYADLVTDDVVWLPPAGAALTSRKAFRRWLEPFFTRYDYEFSLDPSEVRAFDGWCAEVGRFRTVLSTERGDPQEHTGHYFVLWRLDADRIWRIERYVDGIGKSDRRGQG